MINGHIVFGPGGGIPGGGGPGGILSGIQSINLAIGPDIFIRAGSGIESIVRIGNDIYINTSGIIGTGGSSGTTLNCLDAIVWSYASGILQSGVDDNGLCFASGIRAGDGVFFTYANDIIIVNASGAIRSINDIYGPSVSLLGYPGSGIQVFTSGNTIFFGSEAQTNIDLTASGFATYTSLHQSGYIRNIDLLGSGYVQSLNGLINHINIVGSGGTNIWTDGQTIQISAPTSSGGGGINSINGATGPEILLREQLGSGIEILTSGNSIFIGLKPIDLTASGFITKAEVASSGFATIEQLVQSGYTTLNEVQNNIHTSGYIRNVDFISSGFLTRTELQTSGYTTITEVRNDITTSGYELHSDILASGYLRRQDLIGSGYVVSINGLQHNISLVGSGGTNIWTDGQTIQIAAPAASGGGIVSINGSTGPAIFLREQLGSGIEILTSGNSIFFGLKPIDLTSSGFATYTQLQTSGYVQHAELLVSGFLRHEDLLGSGYVRSINGLINTPNIVGSGNIQVWVDGQNIQVGTTAVTLGQVQSDLTTSGYLLASDRMYPVDARPVSGHIIPTAPDLYTLGSAPNHWVAVYAHRGIFNSGVSVSGSPVVYRINEQTGPDIYLREQLGSGVEIFTSGKHIFFGMKPIDLSASGFATYDELHTSGYIRNVDFITSGFLTSAQLNISGYVHHSDMLTSGYLRREDLIGSGYVVSINGLQNAVTLVGSGGTTIWTDGQTIQIAGGGGPGDGPESDQYPVDARAVSGHIIPNTSGQYNIGASGNTFNQIYTNDIRGARVFSDFGRRLYAEEKHSWVRAGLISASMSFPIGYSGLQNARLIRRDCEIIDVILHVGYIRDSISGSGVQISLSSGAINHAPINMYVNNPRPQTQSTLGWNMIVTGFLPDVTTLPANTLLYANVDSPGDAGNGTASSGLVIEIITQPLADSE